MTAIREAQPVGKPPPPDSETNRMEAIIRDAEARRVKGLIAGRESGDGEFAEMTATPKVRLERLSGPLGFVELESANGHRPRAATKPPQRAVPPGG